LAHFVITYHRPPSHFAVTFNLRRYSKDRLRHVINAVLPAFDHHADLQLSGEETEEVGP
jgi:hypothetical protein